MAEVNTQNTKDTQMVLRNIEATSSIKDLMKNFDSRQLSLAEYLAEYMAQKNIVKKDFVKEVEKYGLSKEFCYEILKGKKKKKHSKDLLVSFAILLGMNLEETQRMLSCADCEHLYAKDQRDAIIIYGITHKQTFSEINDNLIDYDFDCLVRDVK